MPIAGSRLPGRRGLALVLLLVVVFLLPTAGAEVQGEVSIQLTSLEEAGIEASLTLSGEDARQLRERADHDDDGNVGILEAAGAEEVLGDRFQGETSAYTLDAAAYTIEQASVSLDGIQGAVGEKPLELSVEAQARASAGQAPHTFAIHGLPTSVIDGAEVAHVVGAPEGYRVEQTRNVTSQETCQARTAPGTSNASVELAASQGACQRETPAPGLVALAVAGTIGWGLSRARPFK